MIEIRNAKVVHFIPGRVRLRVAELKNMPGLSHKLKSAFERIPGVERVEINTLTGSVLIAYDPGTIKSKESIEILSTTLTTYFPTLPVQKLLSWLAKSPQ